MWCISRSKAVHSSLETKNCDSLSKTKNGRVDESAVENLGITLYCSYY